VGPSEGAGRQAVVRWRKRGLSVDEADELAVAMDRHPSEIWPDWYEVCAANPIPEHVSASRPVKTAPAPKAPPEVKAEPMPKATMDAAREFMAARMERILEPEPPLQDLGDFEQLRQAIDIALKLGVTDLTSPKYWPAVVASGILPGTRT
jgi:hypothetical protein